MVVHFYTICKNFSFVHSKIRSKGVIYERKQNTSKRRKLPGKGDDDIR